MERKLFCLSMQRSGTTSVGNWFEAHGLRRATWAQARDNNWTRLWVDGQYDAVFASPLFQDAEILDDAPWWVPGAYRVLAERFAQARFILLERDPEAWFRSMCAHSGGRNPGETDVHCRIYGRDAEIAPLRDRGLKVGARNLVDITRHGDLYMDVYRRHIRDTVAFFADTPQRLFHGRLGAPGVFEAMRDFAGLAADPEIAVPHINSTKQPALDRLAAYMASLS